MNALSQFFDMIATRAVYPVLYSVLSAQSFSNRIKAAGKDPKVHWEDEHSGRPIALVALYQKGVLREDTKNLLKSLKQAGFFVLGVNTLKLYNPESLREFFDCYIEKYNYGRDFGSYKFGFEYIYEKKWDANASRLIMINDSVFCISDKIDAFVDELKNSNIEVLGSTENFEIIHHLGSFCISISQSILTHDKFRTFWEEYSNSDVRPRVIHRGEQKLSKVLKRCVSAPSQFRTLYGSDNFLKRLREDEELIDQAIKNARNSPLTGWKRFSVANVIEELREKHVLRATEYPTDAHIQIEESKLADRIVASDFDGIVRLAEVGLKEGSQLDRETVRRIVISQLTEVYMSGSQIHQNASTLIKMGLPIVKLDGLYRGMFTIQDIQLVTQQLTKDDAEQLQALLLERPFGGDALRGWRRAAFMRGLI